MTITIILLEEITKIYKNKIWKLYRVLQKVLSDRRPQFISKFIEELTKVLGTKKTLFTTYYSQTNSQMK